MDLKETIQAKLKEAMKAGEKQRVTVLRTLSAAIKQVEIDTQKELSNEAVEQVVQRQVKQLSDALKEFQVAGRDDLVEQNQFEIDLLSDFLPEQLSDDELKAAIQHVMDQTGGEAPFGQLMGAVMKEVSGKADGNRVRAMLEDLRS